MAYYWRPDGDFIKKLPNTRKLMPYIMRNRNESVVYFEQKIDVKNTIPFLSNVSKKLGKNVTLFYLLIWRIAQVFHLRPGLNRFVSGNRLYQRRGIYITFSAKKKKSDGSPIFVVKMKIDPKWSFEELIGKVEKAINVGRSDRKSVSDVEMNILFKLPSFLISILSSILMKLNHFGLLPKSMIKHDEMYSSVFIANLGSIGLDSAYHHLYEYGNISIFMTVGKKKAEVVVGDNGKPTVKDLISIKYSFDERIEDGIYGFNSMKILKNLIENPKTEIEIK
jgi:hypothetical protein